MLRFTYPLLAKEGHGEVPPEVPLIKGDKYVRYIALKNCNGNSPLPAGEGAIYINRAMTAFSA